MSVADLEAFRQALEEEKKAHADWKTAIETKPTPSLVVLRAARAALVVAQRKINEVLDIPLR